MRHRPPQMRCGPGSDAVWPLGFAPGINQGQLFDRHCWLLGDDFGGASCPTSHIEDTLPWYKNNGPDQLFATSRLAPEGKKTPFEENVVVATMDMVVEQFVGLSIYYHLLVAFSCEQGGLRCE